MKLTTEAWRVDLDDSEIHNLRQPTDCGHVAQLLEQLLDSQAKGRFER